MDVLRINAGAVLAQTRVLLRRAPAPSLLALAVLAMLDTLTDVAGLGSSGGITIVVGLLSLIFQLMITRALLAALQLRGPDGGSSFWMILGLGILSGLAILLGFVLLVVPGIFLTVRWALSVPILVAEEVGPSDAMRRSWALTEGNFGPVLASLVIVYAPGIALLVAATLLLPSEWSEWLPVLVVLNLVMEATFIVGWHLQVALFAASHGETRERAMADIFA
ncbi:glycerophosphoryl diester phosphodiesterase membrane domain-containing protein [Sphingomonas sanxanigenens]|uniref:Glycerophosphoryl diester phosphodiesterase membrane domain-containing protein n=1 Tax=Sphingomonas sanxanigenens DSM 19645 = NX02 TaxID=1123269 RepID=W0APF9_9SPHN|nr:glycerophosphoryl diester phosphodiesterase membrane domain-containing protein [Sphingomonas sanxanigenens]AHE57505.1 hypothetical protein NX02_29720 [Sphingomonas sanxanigenens DSM 19645 = NX02]